MSRCIKSLVDNDINYIIVDDGSLNNLHLLLYRNVLYLPRNIGTYKAFEVGLKEISTEYVMRVDADDYITGVPKLDKDFDAFVNNIDGKISLNPATFLSTPYAGMGGIVVRTELLKKLWYSETRYYGDIIIFMRLLCRAKCKMNKVCTYVYDREESLITKMPTTKRLRYIKSAKNIMKRELERCKNGG